MLEQIPYELIAEQNDFDTLMLELKGQPWLGIDTEFVGERRFEPLLCLIQIAAPNGNFLIDTLHVHNLGGLLDILADEQTLKITHAGENDYRIFYDQFGILPKNVWDTQIAAGFLGYGYPTAFHKLVSGELKIHLNKHSSVTNWEARPFTNSQLMYALNDVIHLFDIWERQQKRLTQKKRLHWAEAEMLRISLAETYYRTADTEAIGSPILNHLGIEKQAFVLRLFRWRWAEAKRRNVSKENVLGIKHFSAIVRGIDGGRKALLENRLLNERITYENYEIWEKLWKMPFLEADEQILSARRAPLSEDTDAMITKDMLHLLVKYRCNKVGVAHSLVLDKSELSPVMAPVFEDEEEDWRKELLGEELMEWLRRRDPISIVLEAGQCVITMK